MNLIDPFERENQFETDLWQKVKSDWNPSIMDEHYFTDEKKKIIAGRIEKTYTVIGYFHFQHVQVNELLSNQLIKDLNLYSKEITTLVVSKKWLPVKMAIITPYKLSSFPNIDINRVDASGKLFGFMTTYPNYEKIKFKLQMDEVLFKRIEMEIFMQKVARGDFNPT